MSLVKALTGKARYSASARAWVGGFDRKQAYRLLRCVDRDGDRRVVLRDLVVFVFAAWTEELDRLSRRAAGGDEEDRQRRRQLQKVPFGGCTQEEEWSQIKQLTESTCQQRSQAVDGSSCCCSVHNDSPFLKCSPAAPHACVLQSHGCDN